MSNVSYVALSRQAALARELTSIANNVANADTTGFRRDGFLFTEYVNALNGEPSLSQTRIGARLIDPLQGDMIATGGPLDLAIEGKGYFTIETPQGQRLTRAGSFILSDQGVVSTAEGHTLGGEGGAPLVIPPRTGRIVISADGVVSADGEIVGRVELVDADPTTLAREGDNLFRTDAETTPVDGAVIRQAHLEGSNVNVVLEISRMIEVQRAFEMVQQMMNDDAERAKRAIETLGGAR